MKLVELLMKMSHETVTVEMKDGSQATGSLAGVDAAMNMHLRKVTLTAKNKSQEQISTYSVRGNNVRYVILPDTANLDVLLTDVAEPPKKKTTQVKRFPTRGGRAGARGRGARGRGRGTRV